MPSIPSPSSFLYITTKGILVVVMVVVVVVLVVVSIPFMVVGCLSSHSYQELSHKRPFMSASHHLVTVMMGVVVVVVLVMVVVVIVVVIVMIVKGMKYKVLPSITMRP